MEVNFNKVELTDSQRLERHNKRQRISKEALIPIMVKAIQELSEEVKKLKET